VCGVLLAGNFQKIWKIAFLLPSTGDTRWCSRLSYCATILKVAGSIPDDVIGIFHWHNPSGRTTVPGWLSLWQKRVPEIFPGNLDLLELSGPLQACNGVAFPLLSTEAYSGFELEPQRVKNSSPIPLSPHNDQTDFLLLLNDVTWTDPGYLVLLVQLRGRASGNKYWQVFILPTKLMWADPNIILIARHTYLKLLLQQIEYLLQLHRNTILKYPYKGQLI